MPFITEELYQRLPHSNVTKCPSVSVAPYPETVSVFISILIFDINNYENYKLLINRFFNV